MAKGKRKQLTDTHRAWLVTRCACYEKPSVVAADFESEFGMTISEKGVEYYDPTKVNGQKLAKKWRVMFEAVRDEFHKDLATYVPLATKGVRVKHLAEAAEDFRDRRNYIGMAGMLQDIAKEMGNVHTNKREHTGKDGKAMEFEFTDRTPDEMRARFAELSGLLKDELVKVLTEGGSGAGSK